MRRRIIFLVLITLLASMSLVAQTTGRIAGRVRDQDGNPIAFASVSIPELGTGAQTDDRGTYIIINVPPGQYDVICQMMGYQPQRNSGVQVNVNEATILNIELVRTAVQMETFQVVDRREELVSAQRTSSGSRISSEAVQDFTVTDIADIVAVQAGVSVVDGQLHVRGGRANEVQFTIDGMSVSDPVDGGSPLSVDTDAIEVMDTMTGGFPAEYGNAQSGIINIVTRSGDPHYSGKIEFITDHIAGGNHSNSDEIKFAIGGPLLGPAFPDMRNKLTFFLNAGGNWHDSRYREYYEANPTEDLRYLISDEFPVINPYENRDSFLGFDVGDDRNFNTYQFNFRTRYRITPFRNLTFGVRADTETFEQYRHSYRFAQQHTPVTDIDQRQYVATYDHTFNPRMNLSVRGSIFNRQVKLAPKGIAMGDYFWIDEDWTDFQPTHEDTLRHINENPVRYLTFDGIIGDTADIPWNFYSPGAPNDVRTVPFFNQPGTIFPFYIDDENSTYNVRVDFEYQMGLIHNFKTGFEVIKHHIRKDQSLFPWVVDSFRYDTYLRNRATPLFSFESGDIFHILDAEGTVVDSIEFFADTNYYSAQDEYNATVIASGEVDGYEAHPWQAAYYLQDSMQWEGLNVNAGLRFDFWYLGKSYDKFENDGTSETVEFDSSDRFQAMISPRLGVSHPISETTVMHFAYNYQNQLPQMQYIFTSKTPTDAITSDQTVIIGNPKLEPQITVTYEVGLQKQFGEFYVMDLATYYKNIYNYVTTQKVYYQSDGTLIPHADEPQDTSTPMYRYISEDYGSTRGINLNFQRLMSNFVSFSTSYSLAWANGNNSDFVIQDETTSLREFALDWDIRHDFSFNFTFRVGKYEEWYLPMTDILFPIDDFSINFSYDIASGKPYTPLDERDKPKETNSAHMKPNEMAGLRVSKRFAFGESTSMRIYMNVRNLFNRRNEFFVYPRTGSPYYDGADLTTAASDFVSEQHQYIHDMSRANPAFVSNGRTYTFGVSFDF